MRLEKSRQPGPSFDEPYTNALASLRLSDMEAAYSKFERSHSMSAHGAKGEVATKSLLPEGDSQFGGHFSYSPLRVPSTTSGPPISTLPVAKPSDYNGTLERQLVNSYTGASYPVVPHQAQGYPQVMSFQYDAPYSIAGQARMGRTGASRFDSTTDGRYEPSYAKTVHTYQYVALPATKRQHEATLRAVSACGTSNSTTALLQRVYGHDKYSY